MVVIGLILFAAATAAAVILIVQNRGSVVDVHALGHTWTGHLYWVVVAGLIIASVALLGLAIMRIGAVRARRLRRERAELRAEHERLSEHVGDPGTSSFFADEDRADQQPTPSPATGDYPEARRRYLRRSRHSG